MRASSMPLSATEIYQGCRTPSINSKFSESPGTPDLGPSSSARDFYQGFHSPSDWSKISKSSTGTENDDEDHDQPSLTEATKNFDKIFRFPSTNSAVQCRRYSRADIEKITGHFRRQISHGETFEKVYYGKLADGTDVAVKVLSSELWHSSASFDLFKLMIGKFVGLAHKNLLRIVGYYFGKSFSALIMEYTPGGNLARFSRVVYFSLSKPLAPEETKEDFIRFLKVSASAGSLDPKLLTWVQRIQIALGVAQGLEYLHDGCMIHGNVKLANILLDKNLNAKLAEPRYMIFRRFGMQRDVFDFGTVLWFLISGLKFGDSLCRLSEMSELIFQASKHDELPRGLLDSVSLGIKIAGACTFRTPRPDMTLVVNSLKVCMNLAKQEGQSLAKGSSLGSTNI